MNKLKIKKHTDTQIIGKKRKTFEEIELAKISLDIPSGEFIGNKSSLFYSS